MAQTNENLNIFNRGPDSVSFIDAANSGVSPLFEDRQQAPEPEQETPRRPTDEDFLREYHEQADEQSGRGILENIAYDSVGETPEPYDIDRQEHNYQGMRPEGWTAPPRQVEEPPHTPEPPPAPEHHEENSVGPAAQEPEGDPDGLTPEQRAHVNSLPESMRGGIIDAMKSMNEGGITPSSPQQPVTHTQVAYQRADDILHDRMRLRARGSLDGLRNAAKAYSEGSKQLEQARQNAGLTSRAMKNLSFDERLEKLGQAYENNPEYRQAVDNMNGLGKQYFEAANKLGYSFSDANKSGVDVTDIQKEFLDRYNQGEFDANDYGEPKLNPIAEKIEKVIGKLVSFCKRALGLESPEEKQQRKIRKQAEKQLKANGGPEL